VTTDSYSDTVFDAIRVGSTQYDCTITPILCTTHYVVTAHSHTVRLQYDCVRQTTCRPYTVTLYSYRYTV